MALAASLALLGLLWLVFSQVVEKRTAPNRHLVVAPGAEVVLRRGSHGHYVFPGEINGRAVVFLLDTGATLVSVPAHLGTRLGLVPGAEQRSVTANGIVTTRATRIDRLSFGAITLTDVPASLNPGMRNNEILLGMSVLKHLEFTQRGDTLVIRPPGS